MTSHVAEVYVQLDAETYRLYGGDADKVRSIKVVGYTQKRPTRPKPGSVVVRLEIEVPDAAFLPLRPQARVVVPADMTETTPVVVEAVPQ